MTTLARIVLGVFLAATAWGFLHSHRMAWGGADAPDGTRYKVSPEGMVHVLEPRQEVSATVDCGWSLLATAARPCEMVAHARRPALVLEIIPFLPLLAALGCLVAGARLVTHGRKSWRGRLPLLAMSVAAGLAGPLLLDWAAPRALAALGGLAFGVGGTLGTLELVFASALLGGLAAAHYRKVPHGRADGFIAVGLPVLPVIASLLMFPFWGGLGIVLVGLAGGFAAGRFYLLVDRV